MKRIGIFQYKWPLQVHTINLVTKLAESGFQVDLYLYRCNSSFVSTKLLTFHPGVKLFFTDDGDPVFRIFHRIIRKLRRILGHPNPKPLSLEQLVRKTLKKMRSNRYDYFIGIEKNGLIWAGMLSGKLNIPYIYYSLELYIDRHPELDSFINSDVILKEEKKYHARAAGTIIQDQLRAKALFECNGIEEKNSIYIPVSVTGKKINDTSRFLHEKLGIEYSKKIVIYIGWVRKKRGVDELMRCASRLGDDFVMVFHGPFLPEVSTENSFGGKVFFSREMTSSEDIPKIVSSAYIGVAYYGNATINDRLTAFSSEKIAHYMQCGLPVIAHRNESYELLMQQHHCGEMIDNIQQLPEAVQKIDSDYSHYRDNAFTAYEHFYSFDKNIRALTDFLYCH